jgi:Icc protein
MQRRQLLKGLGAIAGALHLPSVVKGAGAAAKQRVLRIAHLTDIHVQPLIGAARGLEKCLHHLQNLDIKPDFIFNGGDAIMGAHKSPRDKFTKQWSLFNDVLSSENGLDIYPCVGNHDIWCGSENAKAFTDGKKWALDEYKIDRPYYSFTRQGWHFMVLDSVQPKPDGSWYTAAIDEAQMDWLKKELESIPASTPVFIMSHIPILSACVFLDGKNYRNGQWNVPGSWMHEDAAELTDLFYKFKNIKIAVSGHLHLLDKVEYNGITYCCNGAVSGAWWFGSYHQTGPGYALIDLYNDGSFRTEYVSYRG